MELSERACCPPSPLVLSGLPHTHSVHPSALARRVPAPGKRKSFLPNALTPSAYCAPHLHPPSTLPPTHPPPTPTNANHHLPRVIPQDVDGTYQSQLRFATRQMEKKFRCRYDTLKALYEDRLQSLSAQLAQIQQTVSQDDVLAQMGADGASAHFVPARREEMVFDLLHSEREQMIERLASDLAKTEAEAKQSFRESQVRECVSA